MQRPVIQLIRLLKSNVLEILSEVGIPIEKASSFNLSVYNKDEIIGSFYGSRLKLVGK